MTLINQVALVSQVGEVGLDALTAFSAALQRQVTRDLGPIWGIQATVDAFANLSGVPPGYWPVVIKRRIPFDGAQGIHLDRNGQPFALVQFSADWRLTVSHESLEMLVDPFGNRLVAGQSPAPGQGRVEFLVEVCDPSESSEFGYPSNGATVSDFYTPNYFDPMAAPGVRYSFTGAITAPRQVLSGGYLSWHDPISDHWFQLTEFGTEELKDLGVQERQNGESLRAMIDRLTTPRQRAFERSRPQPDAGLLTRSLRGMSDAGAARASRLQAEIDAISE